MARTITLLLCLLIGCSRNPIDDMDKNPSGQTTLSGLLLIESVNNFPLGLSAKKVFASLQRSSLLKYYNRNDSLFYGAFSWVEELKGIHETILLSQGGYPSFRLDFFRDTCVTLFLMDSTRNQAHVTACVALIASKFGMPDSRHFDSLELGHVRVSLHNVDEYKWHWGAYDMTLQHRKEWNDYWFKVTNQAQWSVALHVIDSISAKYGYPR